uniref:Uncharacterized protein n=2 Tax=Emiliania huxleyi TaxID=2903 RepID=A0A7S3RQU3_EMIHU
MPGSSYPSNLGLPQRPVGLYSNKATALRDLQHAHRKHVERLRTMKHTIDLTPVKPVKMSAGKKLQNMAERNATIERDNKLLLSKMYQIMNADNPYLKEKPRAGQVSLNTRKRREEHERIARENQAIMQRILGRRSNFDVSKLEREWKQTQSHLRRVCQEPWVLDQDTIPKRKLKSLSTMDGGMAPSMPASMTAAAPASLAMPAPAPAPASLVVPTPAPASGETSAPAAMPAERSDTSQAVAAPVASEAALEAREVAAASEVAPEVAPATEGEAEATGALGAEAAPITAELTPQGESSAAEAEGEQPPENQ